MLKSRYGLRQGERWRSLSGGRKSSRGDGGNDQAGRKFQALKSTLSYGEGGANSTVSSGLKGSRAINELITNLYQQLKRVINAKIFNLDAFGAAIKGKKGPRRQTSRGINYEEEKEKKKKKPELEGSWKKRHARPIEKHLRHQGHTYT